MPESQFDLREFFREVRLFADLLTRPEERAWLAEPVASPERKQVVLYLGCNLLRTPHLAQTVIEVLRRLGEDFVAVAGPAYCCGSPLRQNGEERAALRLGENSFSLFQAFAPERVVMWCPTCLRFYRELRREGSSPYLQHITAFLAERAEHLPWQREVVEKVALHYHLGDGWCQEEADAARYLLAAIPGLEVVEVGTDRVLGRNCSARYREAMGKGVWGVLISSFMERAMMQGATTVAPIYHSCHRLLCGYERLYPVKIENFITLLGRALGIEFEDKFKKYLLWEEESWIVADARSCLEASGTGAEQVRPLIRRNFVQGKVS